MRRAARFIRAASTLRLPGTRRDLPRGREPLMEKYTKEALQVTKEIMVKFIETGRTSPTNFAEIFPGVYRVVLETITRPCAPAGEKRPGDKADGAS